MARIIADENLAPEIKRFLRSQDTQQYFKEGGWTTDPCQAKSFADILEAAEFCAKLHLEHVELALRAQATGPDLFCTPLR